MAFDRGQGRHVGSQAPVGGPALLVSRAIDGVSAFHGSGISVGGAGDTVSVDGPVLVAGLLVCCALAVVDR